MRTILLALTLPACAAATSTPTEVVAPRPDTGSVAYGWAATETEAASALPDAPDGRHLEDTASVLGQGPAEARGR